MATSSSMISQKNALVFTAVTGFAYGSQFMPELPSASPRMRMRMGELNCGLCRFQNGAGARREARVRCARGGLIREMCETDDESDDDAR